MDRLNFHRDLREMLQAIDIDLCVIIPHDSRVKELTDRMQRDARELEELQADELIPPTRARLDDGLENILHLLRRPGTAWLPSIPSLPSTRASSPRSHGMNARANANHANHLAQVLTIESTNATADYGNGSGTRHGEASSGLGRLKFPVGLPERSERVLGTEDSLKRFRDDRETQEAAKRRKFTHAGATHESTTYTATTHESTPHAGTTRADMEDDELSDGYDESAADAGGSTIH